MQGGGHIRGWRVDGAQNAQIEEAARALEKEGLAFAVGDGNHSLAAARRCWELSGEPLARWALVEIVNVYDEALVFEPIHGPIFGRGRGQACAPLCARASRRGGRGAAVRRAGGRVRRGLASCSRCWTSGRGKTAPPSITSTARTWRAAWRRRARRAFCCPVIPKEELFAQVRLHGALPRKAFSMGAARDKRYYLECRRIRP